MSKVIEEGTIKPMLERSITPDWFTQDEDRQVARWVFDWNAKYGKPPSPQLVVSNYPGYRMVKVEDPAESLCDLMVARRRRGIVTKTAVEIADRVEEADHESAVAAMRASLAELDRASGTVTSDLDLTKDASQRFSWYEELKNRPNGLLGLPTGFPTIDRATAGLQPGQLVTLIASAKVGKALDVDTPILTPSGWTRMGDLVVGDEVFGPDGLPTKVIGAYDTMHGHRCYRVTTADGRSIVADEEHLWTVRLHGSRFQTVTTQDLVEFMSRNPKRRPIIRLHEPIRLSESDLPVDPYVFGVWLGDGSSRTGQITNSEEAIWERIGKTYSLGDPYFHNNSQTRTVDGLRSLLRGLGVLGNKHIPGLFLYASVDQRMALLRGIMDSDGYVSINRAGSRRCEVIQVSERLSQDILWLARSLGFKATLTHGRATLHGRDVSPKYRVTFPATLENAPFSLDRHLARLLPTGGVRRRSLGLPVKEIIEVESRPVRCITVQREDGMFLAGRDLLPTHNSVTSLQIASNIHQHPSQPRVMFQSFEMSNFEQQSRHDAMRAHISHANLRRGQLTSEEELAYRRMLEEMEGMPNEMILTDSTTGTTVSMLAAKIDDLGRPDLIVVDGIYLMIDELTGESSTPQSLTNITRSLKRLAQQIERPIFCTTQALQWKMKKTRLNSQSAGYSSSIVQDSDVVLGLERVDEDMDEARILRVLMSRNCGPVEALLRWDFDNGRFEEETL